MTGFKVFADDHECGEIPATPLCQSATIPCNGAIATVVQVKKSPGTANIVEIEVYGVRFASMNLALHRPVTVSSEWGGHSIDGPNDCHSGATNHKPGSLLTDGVTKDVDLPPNSGYWQSCDVSKDPKPRASIDLGIGPVSIASVVVHNRCCCTACETCNDEVPKRGRAGNGTTPGC